MRKMKHLRPVTTRATASDFTELSSYILLTIYSGLSVLFKGEVPE